MPFFLITIHNIYTQMICPILNYTHCIFDSELILYFENKYGTYKPICNLMWLTDGEPNLSDTFLDKATILDFWPYWNCSHDVLTECTKFINNIAKKKMDEIFTLIIKYKIDNDIDVELEIEI